ncbi:hypothetical protein F8A10_11575 [Paracoccus kondratievae]|uniref:YMGG-like Gly-zipper domain-containing protein n=1 Tax=Paracoccus kondratievae TaxID=135740 RepID=A0AAD3RVK5_9RHOB|nr:MULTISPECIES: hypothetical protein [Paracoccus]QFQ88153.1 hypothetical protein F8A10_11575 [Paracoccus kondratievae]GLK65927.1 hypothetical protein GCM10017635_34040 [Paracoccus kondratievae]SMG43891.1 hypothetical protein SAMN02746000_02636 [Paracoccus sp. J56]
MQTSVLLRLSGAVLLVAGLAACDQGYGTATGLSPDAQRAAGGALAGAAVAKIVDGDVATGALIGAAGGALCDDAGVCQRNY